MNEAAQNPFRPGAGQPPVYLAGRTQEQDHFTKLLAQKPVLSNVILTGLRGVGKTVLLQNFKNIAQRSGWLWTGNDLSESASLTEERVAKRIVTDLSVLLGPIVLKTQEERPMGFLSSPRKAHYPLEFKDLWNIYDNTPGLTDDKIKAVIARTQEMVKGAPIRGIVFAYDEAQNLTDHAKEKEFPLSILLDVFASIQKDHTKIPIMLVLTGLPTLFPRLNEARTYTERMFSVMSIDKLSDGDSRLAIEKPIEITKSNLRFSENAVGQILDMSGGYPYFLQYVCKEVFDAWINRIEEGEAPSVPMSEIVSKLDQDFFSPRWERTTDRQQDFMSVIAQLPNANSEFSAQEIVEKSKSMEGKDFSPSHSVQMLKFLSEKGLIFKNKHGKYLFAVPLMSDFINRQLEICSH